MEYDSCVSDDPVCTASPSISAPQHLILGHQYHLASLTTNVHSFLRPLLTVHEAWMLKQATNSMTDAVSGCGSPEERYARLHFQHGGSRRALSVHGVLHQGGLRCIQLCVVESEPWYLVTLSGCFHSTSTAPTSQDLVHWHQLFVARG